MDEVNDFISRQYYACRDRSIGYCRNKGYEWIEDVFHDTLVKMQEIHQRNGLDDTSDKGLMNYFFRAFTTNLARYWKYPDNYRLERLPERYNIPVEHHENAECFSDWAVAGLARAVEMSPDITDREFNFWRLKSLTRMTYAQMSRKYGVGARELRRINRKVKDWIRENYSLDALKQQYNDEQNAITNNDY